MEGKCKAGGEKKPLVLAEQGDKGENRSRFKLWKILGFYNVFY